MEAGLSFTKPIHPEQLLLVIQLLHYPQNKEFLQMLKLFAVLLGGYASRCTIELHDVVFVIGESLESTYSELRKKWFGILEHLHIDASIELNYVDQYRISVETHPQKNCDQKLFFVNFGGYQSNYFAEYHERGFFVATDKKTMLEKARKKLCTMYTLQHEDDCLILQGTEQTEHSNIDDVIEIRKIDSYYIHLTKIETPTPALNIQAFYRKIPAINNFV